MRLVRLLAWLMVAVATVAVFGIVDLMTLPGWVRQRHLEHARACFVTERFDLI